MKKELLFVLLLALFGYTFSQSDRLETALFELPDVIFKKLDAPKGMEAVYQLKIKQPIDHKDLTKGYFYQRVFLSHNGFDRPTVIVTEGYSRPRNRIYELTKLLEANQVDVEHRFFGESMPDSLEYDYLNLEQATADLHHIRELLGNIYKEKWISTGISKGGSTTIFYRYFYPDDVDVSVPYVAPINNAFEDQRLYTFLDTIGSDECRKKIKDFQVSILKNRDQVMPLLKFYSLGAGANYTYLSEEAAFELSVMEYPFSFWQYGHNCDEIPGKDVGIEDIVEYLLSVSEPTFFGDDLIERFGSHYYQAAAEMGYYGYETAEFKDLLKAISTKTNPHATFLPNKMKVKFDGRLLDKVNEWLKTQANQFIYINGALDTWSGTAVPPNDKVEAEWFFMKDKHHSSARIKQMTDAEKARLVSVLEKWLGMDIDEKILDKKE